MNGWSKAVAIVLAGAWSSSGALAQQTCGGSRCCGSSNVSLAAYTPQEHGEHGEHGEHSGQGKDEMQAASQEQPPRAASKLPVCPVMGNPVDFSISSMTEAGPVYFCCPMCLEAYGKSPAKYAKQVAAQRAFLAKMKRVQVNCPVTGNPIDGKTIATIDGEVVSFCCTDCVSKYEGDPKQFKAKLEASYTYQTVCPVTGAAIDATMFVDMPTGERIYVCCPGCDKKILENPAKYAPKLAAQGINLDLKKLAGAKDDAAAGHAGHDHGHP